MQKLRCTERAGVITWAGLLFGIQGASLPCTTILPALVHTRLRERLSGRMGPPPVILVAARAACAKLCHSHCGAYGGGEPVSCGPCVQNVQTCILCGGATTTRSCDLVVCGDQICSPGAQCCGHHCCPPTWCPEGTHCCSDGDGCCPDGSACGNIFGWHFCIPFFG
jgi:hypothetical protein